MDAEQWNDHINVLLFREMTALHAAFAPKTIELAEQGTNLI